MAIVNNFNMMPFARMFEVKSEGATGINLMTLPAFSILTGAIVEVKTACTGGSTPLVSVGTGTDPDTIIDESAADGTAGTIYGDATADVGTAWKVACGASSGYEQMPSGMLMITDTTIYIVLDQAVTTEGVYRVWLYGWRCEV